MILKTLMLVLPKILLLSSPPLRDFIKDVIHQMEQNAAKTDNVWDDVLVAVLKAALGIKE